MPILRQSAALGACRALPRPGRHSRQQPHRERGLMPTWKLLVGDVRDRLAELPDQSVQCCVTSPPYWGLRDYGVDGQIGLEATPDDFLAAMVAVFREVKRVLKDDG